jgi:beta-mannosidase
VKGIQTLDLTGRWQFKAVDAYHTLPTNKRPLKQWMNAEVPGTVHTDLLAHGLIPDPFYRSYENRVQWIDAVQWKYRRVFTLPAEMLAHEKVELIAFGLDTYAEIRCNNRRVGSTADMFVEHRLDLKRFLRRGRNTLEILFDSPTERSKALSRKHGVLQAAPEPHRAYVRKAQYSFGWDWGPRLTTSGIWKDIGIEAYSTARLKDPFVRVISADRKMALLEVSVNVHRLGHRTLRLTMALEGASWSYEKTVPATSRRVRARIRVPRPHLWWPNGHGAQPLYSAVLTLSNDGEKLDELQLPFAIRTVRLVRKKDSAGESFIVEVNGARIFCKGADWIPSDSFIPRIVPETYETLLHMARDAHMNMIRVWGGGIYETDYFYDLCDRLGIMVWQDFMFACGEYPDLPWFRTIVRDEALKVVKRLRNHPSVVLWCGNNECEWLFTMENPGKRPDQMPGAAIFRDLLSSLVSATDGTRPYWRSSPFGRGFPNDETNGNHHQWQVWSGWKDYPVYEKDGARFVTEFGFQSAANRQTMESVTLPADRHPQSRVMEHHNKQIEGTERLIRFQASHHLVASDFDDFIYKTQLVQAEALKLAVEHWRRRKFHTAGALFWQLNDCWPVSSWSAVDSALRPKAAYYFAKKFYSPLLVSVVRGGEQIEIWLTNDLLYGIQGELDVSLRSFSGAIRWRTTKTVAVPANRSTCIMKIPSARTARLKTQEDYLLAEVKVGGKPATENRFFFDEPKHLRLPTTRITAKLRASLNGAHLLLLHSSRFAKNVRAEFEGLDVRLDDNYVDIDAGKNKIILLRSTASPGRLRKSLRLTWLHQAGTKRGGFAHPLD